MPNDSTDTGALSAFPQGAETGQPVGGLTKREWMAAMCLQGILANRSIHKYTLWSATQSAIMYADQLLMGLKSAAPDEGGLPQPDSRPPLVSSTSR
jgi:hypothetical protein